MLNIFVLLATASHFYFARSAVSNFYVGVAGPKSWSAAQQQCESGVWVRATGGKLATWDSFDEYKNRVVPAANYVGLNAYVGLSDLSAEGHWLFVDASPPGDQDNNPAWSPGQPDDWAGQGGQDCGYIWGASSKTDGNVKGLDDRRCSDGINYVCEFSATFSYLGKQDDIYGPNLDFPYEDHTGNKNNYFVFEFSSDKDMIILASIMLNVVLMAAVCGSAVKRACGFKSGGSYSKVNVYSTDAEDAKLNI